MNHIAIDAIATGLIVIGLAGAIVPAVPGIPVIFGGIWLIAWSDHFEHIGRWSLIGIAIVGSLGLAIDLVAGALGAKRVGAGRQALCGALLGTVVGLFFGIPGLLIGPFLGAVVGELSAGSSILRSAHVGVGAWAGLIFGTIVKLVASVTMVGLLLAGWWLHR